MTRLDMTTASSNVEWRVYGKLDCGASHDLAAGLAEWRILREHLRQCGLTRMSQCVEIGCGGGRLTNALAGDFSVVHALDVSRDRIEQASAVPNAQNVRFHLVQGPPIPVPADSSDLCISTHVFQHISSTSTIEKYFREIYRVLRPGGLMLVHVPVIGAHGRTGELAEVFARRVKDIAKSLAQPMTRLLFRKGVQPRFLRVANYRIFAWVKLGEFLQKTGFDEVQLRILPWGGWHSYVFARKPLK
jgi:ubiquinone/menaquinone biosynthesis C-methylase UbiE